MEAVVTKHELRRRLLAARATRIPLAESPDQWPDTATRLAEVGREVPEIAAASTVAAYAALPGEPDLHLLLSELRNRGATVLLPALESDGDLNWAAYDGNLDVDPRGIPTPTGPRLGRAAIATADVVLVPGLAVDRHGTRLGRGGGSYDRALRRVPPGRLTAVVLYDDELLEHVPAEPHDTPVTAFLTPTGLHRLTPGGHDRATLVVDER